MKYLKYLFLTFCFFFWPIALFLGNPNHFSRYAIPGFLVLISLLIFERKSSKLKIIAVIILIFSLSSVLKATVNDSIFTYDPLSFDTQVKKVGLIPNRTLGRVVQNKYTVYLDKFTSNVFLTFDINNYFFSLHPRETGNTQNLNKFPYISLPLFLIGLYILIISRKKYLFIYLFTATFFLSLMANSDKYDFLLWPFIFLSISNGADYLMKKYSKFATFYFLFTLPLIIFDFARLFF